MNRHMPAELKESSYVILSSEASESADATNNNQKISTTQSNSIK